LQNTGYFGHNKYLSHDQHEKKTVTVKCLRKCLNNDNDSLNIRISSLNGKELQ
jgi:hypothetical protein